MRKGLMGLLAVAVVVIVGLYFGMGMQKSAIDANNVQPAANATEASATASAADDGKADVKADAAAPADEHGKTYALGNPDAPIKIKEFASLSCSHCAAFATETFPEVKKQLIDTGKVYFEFVHFPLNAPAMDGALIALCMPEERYHQFLSFLFEQQAQWAFSADYRQILKQNAKLLGASEDKLEACLNDEKKKAEIVKNMQDADTKYNVRSTPSFVVNDKVTFGGAMSFEDFKKRVEAVAVHDEKDAE